MPIIQQQQTLPYSAKQMYQLVNDIGKYPQFLPLCTSARILSSAEDTISAVLFIQKGPLHLSFSTQNKLIPFTEIHMNLLDGPFEYLSGVWQFNDLSQGSQVRLRLEFEMKGKLLKFTLGPLFSTLAQSMVQVFCTRAKQIYG